MTKGRRRKLILAGDVGGTKTYIGLFEKKAGRLHGLCVERLLNASFPSAYAAIEDFLERRSPSGASVHAAVFGVAGPVVNNSCTLTNIGWRLDDGAIQKRLGIKRVRLMNDLVAMGYGVASLGKTGFMSMQRGRPEPGNGALIAAGTGLGESVLFWDGTRHAPSASEAGHADFAPGSVVEAALFEHMHKIFGHVSVERVLSGPGIGNIYDFLRSRAVGKGRAAVYERLKQADDRSEVIFNEAVSGRDRLCKESLRIFVAIYGREAGNLALRAMSVNGLYIGGGIGPRVLMDRSLSGVFLDAFISKGRFKGFLRRVPVMLILDDRAGLYGAARCGGAILD